MRHLFSALSVLAVLALSGCKEGCIEEDPIPACYSGKIVGATCMDGLLIDVDSQYAIGKPYSQYSNVVAATNLQQQTTPEYTIDGQVVQAGQTIYFMYTLDPGTREAYCPQNTVSVPVPHLVLHNVGTSACGVSKTK